MSELRVVLCAGLLAGGVAAAVAAAAVRLAAPVASVRLGEMTAAYTARAAAEGRTAEEVRAWGDALETALDRVAERRGVVLLPVRAVAAGTLDATRHVEAVLAELLARHRAEGAPPGEGR